MDRRELRQYEAWRDEAQFLRAENQHLRLELMACRPALYRADQRVADLSVEHANVVQHYRAARVLADTNREGRANTEELRQAFVHYRVLFADLLAEPELAHRQLQEARV